MLHELSVLATPNSTWNICLRVTVICMFLFFLFRFIFFFFTFSGPSIHIQHHEGAFSHTEREHILVD